MNHKNGKEPKKRKTTTNGKAKSANEKYHNGSKHKEVGSPSGKSIKKLAALAPNLPPVDPGECLQDIKLERLALLVASGYSWTAGYMEAFMVTYKTAESNAWTAKGKTGVKERVAFLRNLMSADKVADQLLILHHYREVVGTPGGIVDPAKHPLVEGLKRKRRMVGKGEKAKQWEYEEFDLPNKNDAAWKLAQLQGLVKDDKLSLDLTITTQTPEQSIASLAEQCRDNPTLLQALSELLQRILTQVEEYKREAALAEDRKLAIPMEP